MQMNRILLTMGCALALGGSSSAQTGERERLEAERAAIADRIAATTSLLAATREDRDRST